MSMSAAAIEWARGTGQRGSAAAVLLALASYHSARTGECRPGLDALCAASGLARATVWAALKALRKAGFVAWRKGSDARGQRATNVYTLHMVSGEPKVQLPNSGGDEPKVQYTDVGNAIPKFSSRTRIQEDTGPSQQKGFRAGALTGTTTALAGRSPFVPLPPRHPTPQQIDAAVAGAWAHFEAMDDPLSPEAWR